MLEILNYESRARNITFEKCHIFLSDNNKYNKLTIEHRNQEEMEIIADNEKLLVKRIKFTTPNAPVLFIHASQLIGRSITAHQCNIIASLNSYNLTLNLDNSQIKLFGQSNSLKVNDKFESVLNAKSFNCGNVQTVSKTSTKLMVNTYSEDFTKEKHVKKHQQIYHEFIHKHACSPFFSNDEKKYYKNMLSFL